MRKILIVFLSIVAMSCLFLGCGGGKKEGFSQQNKHTLTNADGGLNAGGLNGRTPVDVVLFIGQSNMAGRGTAAEATVVPEGHAYEFRAISDPTKLYPVTEPFGVNENNEQSRVTENKKTGSMVSAVCESYYQTTGVPIVAVSCSQGGTGINFWSVDRPAYADACNRVRLAQEYISGNAEFSLRKTFVVWLQGEQDGGNAVTAERYTKTLDSIFDGFTQDVCAEQCFVIPIGDYNGSDQTTKDNYTIIREAQIDYCANNDKATCASIQLYDLSLYGFMKDAYHFYQSGYEIVGKDVGQNMGYFANTGKAPEYQRYVPQEFTHNTGGSWLENEGRVVIPAISAMEQSYYASNTSRYQDGELYHWEKYYGQLDGIKHLPDSGSNWNTGTGLTKSAQVTYRFNLTQGGRYYLYMLTCHPSTGSNSVLACIDDGSLKECADGRYGNGIWLSGSAWYFDIENAGEHTLTLCAREDGVIINQIMLSKNSAENVTSNTPLDESERGEIPDKKEFVEVNGRVCIDLYSAFENSDYANFHNCTYENIDYYWERSVNGAGVQIMPYDASGWTTPNYRLAPYLSYKVNFATTGRYYVYTYTSFMDAQSDSMMISIDDGTPVELTRAIPTTGNNRWTINSSWYIDITTKGVHTVKILARETGAIAHKLYLSTQEAEPVGAKMPAESPRLGIDKNYAGDGSVLITAVDGVNSYDVNLNSENYYVYGLIGTAGNSSITIGDANKNFDGAYSGWALLGSVNGEQSSNISYAVTGDLSVEYLYLESESLARTDSVETLVFGDSYTSKTYWAEFDSQMSPIGGITIGISGTEVNNWTSRINDLKLYNPKNIVIHLGVNDINRGDSGSTCGNEIISLLRSIRQELPNAKIFYVAICNNNSHRSDGKWNEYAISNSIVSEYANTDDMVYFIDFASIMTQQGSSLNNNGFSGDNLHMSSEGYVLFSNAIVEAVKSANQNTDKSVGEE